MWSTDNYLKYVYDELRRELVKHDLPHADETELQVLHEPGKAPQSKSWMWLYRTSGDAERPIVLYEYQPGRGQEYPKKFLEGFRGYLQTDGYAGYSGLDNVRHVGCWAHARRGFDEATKSVPKGKRSPTAERRICRFNSGGAEREASGAVEAGLGRHVGVGEYQDSGAEV